jgi:hypothetical protein
LEIKGCNLNPGDILPDEDSVFFRVLRFNVSGDVRRQIQDFLTNPNSVLKKEDIHVQEGFFKPRRFVNGSYERGTSVDWSDCITPKSSIKNHTTRHKDSDFGIVNIIVKSIHNVIFANDDLQCEYDPVDSNQAHSLIIGFPDEIQAETEFELEFMTLRQQMSEISSWEIFPDFN